MDPIRRSEHAIPRAGTLDRDVWARDLARSMCEKVPDVEELEMRRLEQFLCGLMHYLLGKVHDRPEFRREEAVWRGKHGLLPLMGGMMDRYRNMPRKPGTEPVRQWLNDMADEATSSKYNPVCIQAFRLLARLEHDDLENMLHNASCVVLLSLGQEIPAD
ncbi:hypothetical protein [Nisaea nitritireducens]|uniref:hypothetical protein n=1 Tax=Nisaea nitritireducens TaxID=568392 RepID=UPI001868787A|nr:hypothetical protein [Nisaea nitritireducens]